MRYRVTGSAVHGLVGGAPRSVQDVTIREFLSMFPGATDVRFENLDFEIEYEDDDD